MTQEFAGKLFRIAGAAATVGLAACVHAAAESVPITQIMAMRAGISMVLILAYGVLTVPARTLLPVRYRPHLIRGAIACVAMALTYIAFARLPVTQAQTLTYLAPVLVVPFAMWRLKERFTAATGAALVLGFAGVLLILGLTFDAGRAAFIGALGGTGRGGADRGDPGDDPGDDGDGECAVHRAVVHGDRVRGHEPVRAGRRLGDAARRGVLGAHGRGGVRGAEPGLSGEALSRAPAATLAPLDYTGLIWALLVDWLIFSQVPGPLGILGSVLITAAALIVVLKRAAPATVRPAEP
jgi:drug/metabolite transporter (DMT)-like permease